MLGDLFSQTANAGADLVAQLASVGVEAVETVGSKRARNKSAQQGFSGPPNANSSGGGPMTWSDSG